jgi:gliding motility-associated lipoprotein GldH
MRNLIGILVLVLSIGFLSSCSLDVVYEQMEEIDPSGWDYKDPVTFNFTAPDTTNKYNLIFDIRITPDYGYQNLWLFIETTEPDGFTHTDSVNCPMSFPDGKWIGSGTGNMIDTPVLIHRSFKFTKLGDYQFKVKHGMRNDALPNVQNLGVILKRLND